MSLWLIGAGNMSKDYAHVLNSLKQDFKVIGRNKLSAEKFFEDTGIRVYEGGILKAGKPEELVEDEMVRRVYLGQNFELRKTKIDFNVPKADVEI